MSDVIQHIGSVPPSFEAKASDARLGDKARQYSGQGQKRNKQHHHDGEDDHAQTQISIGALILYLEDMLAVDQPSQDYVSNHSYLAPWMRAAGRAANSNIPAARGAAKAYGHAARTGSSSRRLTRTQDQTQLNDTQIAHIRRMIHDLYFLQKQGLHHIHVDENESFLNGVTAAISVYLPDDQI